MENTFEFQTAVSYVQALATQAGRRLDSGQTFVLARALIEVKAEILREEHGPLKGYQLIPLNTSTDPGAEQISYRLYSDIGQARIIGNYAEDVPIISTAQDEFLHPVFTIAAGWVWTFLDLDRAIKGNYDLAAEGPRAVRDAILRKIDEVLAIGVPEANSAGFVNHPNVTTVTLTNGDWLNPATTPEQIGADLLELEESIIGGTLENHYPDTLVLPGPYYQKLGEKRSTGSDETIWEAFVKSSQRGRSNLPGEWSIHRWSYLDEVEGAPRAAMYERDPSVLEAEVPEEYRELAPQPKNLQTVQPVVGRVAGTVFKRPLAASYATNIGA